MHPLVWMAGAFGVAALYGVCWAVQCVLVWLIPDDETPTEVPTDAN